VSPPSFTIVTPCLNAAATLPATLASVREQRYGGDVEHLVVDGGSVDGTLDILAAAPSVRYVSEPDRGLSDAVNKGIRMASGDVVGWLNADDLYLPGALERVGAALAERPDALWATGPCLIIDGEGREIRRFVTRYKSILLRRYSYRMHLVQNFVASPSTFIRREAFDRVGALDERFRYSMDYDLWLRLGRVAPPLVLDRPLAAFRMAEGSLSMTGFERQFAEHAQNAREHGDGHRVAVAANSLASRGIVAAYRGMRRLRRSDRRRSSPASGERSRSR
jgi:glycosyltransferase involved in cell wall biosynthesis